MAAQLDFFCIWELGCILCFYFLRTLCMKCLYDNTKLMGSCRVICLSHSDVLSSFLRYYVWAITYNFLRTNFFVVNKIIISSFDGEVYTVHATMSRLQNEWPLCCGSAIDSYLLLSNNLIINSNVQTIEFICTHILADGRILTWHCKHIASSWNSCISQNECMSAKNHQNCDRIRLWTDGSINSAPQTTFMGTIVHDPLTSKYFNLFHILQYKS